MSDLISVDLLGRLGVESSVHDVVVTRLCKELRGFKRVEGGHAKIVAFASAVLCYSSAPTFTCQGWPFM